MVTMGNKSFAVGNDGNQGTKWVWIVYVTMATRLFTLGQKQPKGVAGFSYKGSVDIL
jgi:hypothetical protein